MLLCLSPNKHATYSVFKLNSVMRYLKVIARNILSVLLTDHVLITCDIASCTLLYDTLALLRERHEILPHN
jgi:hypothetical protein